MAIANLDQLINALIHYPQTYGKDTTTTKAASRAIVSPPFLWSLNYACATSELRAFKHPSRTHASTDAHRGDAMPDTAPLQLIQQRDRDPGAATPEGMP